MSAPPGGSARGFGTQNSSMSSIGGVVSAQKASRKFQQKDDLGGMLNESMGGFASPEEIQRQLSRLSAGVQHKEEYFNVDDVVPRSLSRLWGYWYYIFFGCLLGAFAQVQLAFQVGVM